MVKLFSRQTPEMTAVRKAINALPDKFTLDDVEKFIEYNESDLSISREIIAKKIGKLVERKVIEVLQERTGRELAIYGKC